MIEFTMTSFTWMSSYQGPPYKVVMTAHGNAELEPHKFRLLTMEKSWLRHQMSRNYSGKLGPTARSA